LGLGEQNICLIYHRDIGRVVFCYRVVDWEFYDIIKNMFGRMIGKYYNVDVSGKIQTRVPHQIEALPTRPFSWQIKRESWEVCLDAVHHVV